MNYDEDPEAQQSNASGNSTSLTIINEQTAETAAQDDGSEKKINLWTMMKRLINIIFDFNDIINTLSHHVEKPSNTSVPLGNDEVLELKHSLNISRPRTFQCPSQACQGKGK